jgi:acyl carrier protein
MGLDVVEFFHDLEESFELSIPHADATRLRTPGLVVDYLFGE